MTALDLPLLARGKVRDVYEVDDDHLLLVASDRLSAYDVVLPTAVPDKGAVLTALSRWWFPRLADLVPHHLDDGPLPPGADPARSMLVRRLEMVPVECVVRGYLTGSGLEEYRRSGQVCGVRLPPGLRDGDRLPEPVFTPTTKAELGAHDEPVTFEQVADRVGGDLANRLRDISLAVYRRGAEVAERAGILVADTKVELGRDRAGVLTLGDEVLTPDSSRFWPADTWRPGGAQPSFDKQYVRDWLSRSGWDRRPPGPELPPEVVAQTRARYVEAYERITGGRFDGERSG